MQQSRVQQSRVQQTAHVMRLWVFSLHQQRSHESDSIITCLPTMAEQLCTGDISCLPGNCGIYVRMQEEQAQRTARYARCRGRRRRRRRGRRMIDEEEDCHEEFVYKKILSKRKRVFLFKRKSNARGCMAVLLCIALWVIPFNIQLRH